MPSLGVVTLAGKSGKPYRFRAYPRETIFKKGFAAVYLLTQRRVAQATGAMRHKALALGQSPDLRQGGAGPAGLTEARVANCICVLAERDEATRLEIQQDLADACGSRGRH